jgi:hypothetical protein
MRNLWVVAVKQFAAATMTITCYFCCSLAGSRQCSLIGNTASYLSDYTIRYATVHLAIPKSKSRVFLKHAIFATSPFSAERPPLIRHPMAISILRFIVIGHIILLRLRNLWNRWGQGWTLACHWKIISSHHTSVTAHVLISLILNWSNTNCSSSRHCIC